MTAQEYKALVARPGSLKRVDVECILAILVLKGEDRLADYIQPILSGIPLEKPAGHTGGPESDFLPASLPAEALDEVVTVLGDLLMDRIP